MSVVVPVDVEVVLGQLLESGRYTNADDALREAVRLLAERDRRLQWLRAELVIAEEQIEQGDLIDFTPELLAELSHQAEENARNEKPIKDAVKP